MKKLLLTFALAGIICFSAQAQDFYLDINYQSFRPFIHFQLQLGNQQTPYSPYRSSYIKGYLDGVNSTYYSDYRFYDLVRDINAYEAGYRDGLRDQQLFCRLNGYRRLPRRPFSYNDYYSPQIAIQIWLNDLTFTFLRAPERRLPHYWARRAQPAVRRYRQRFNNHAYFAHVQKQYKANRRRLTAHAQTVRRRVRGKNANAGNRSRSIKSHKLDKNQAMQRVRRSTRSASTPDKIRTRRVTGSQPHTNVRAKATVRRKTQSRQRTQKPHRSIPKVQKRKVKPHRSSAGSNHKTRASHTRKKQSHKSTRRRHKKSSSHGE